MSDLTMLDTELNSQFRAGASAYAGYVDGGGGDQPNWPYVLSAFPQAQHVGIALSASHAFDPAVRHRALDVENGAETPASVPGWHAAQVADGIERPILYASAYLMRDGILPVLKGAGIDLASTRLWTAHFGQRHICSPVTCGLLPVGADGTQWNPAAFSLDLDESDLLANFFGELPKDWTYGPPVALSATGGHTSVRLSWQPPQGYPVLPAAYRIWVYRGTRANKATLVPTYFRDAGNGALEWEGGGLEQGRVYTAHVSAMGPENTRLRDYGFAAAIFMTG
jgi:hypothetical protein